MLTGLANRTFLEESLALALQQDKRSERCLGVLFCDLDGFKEVNDRLGHHVGDELLRTVAERLSETARSSDLIARFAGDEFVVICPELDRPESLEPIAHRLAEAVSRPATLSLGEAQPRLSIGMATARADDSAEELLRRADQSMYVAKRAAKRSLSGGSARSGPLRTRPRARA